MSYHHSEPQRSVAHFVESCPTPVKFEQHVKDWEWMKKCQASEKAIWQACEETRQAMRNK